MSEQKSLPTIQQPSAALEMSLGPVRTRAAVSQSLFSALCQFSRSDLRDLDIFLSRLTDLVARENRHTRHRMRISSKRQIEDKKMERNRAVEDEKYYTNLANRAQENKQKREKQITKNKYLEIIKRALDAQANASLYYLFYNILNSLRVRKKGPYELLKTSRILLLSEVSLRMGGFAIHEFRGLTAIKN
jgi:hypothetical protein